MAAETETRSSEPISDNEAILRTLKMVAWVIVGLAVAASACNGFDRWFEFETRKFDTKSQTHVESLVDNRVKHLMSGYADVGHNHTQYAADTHLHEVPPHDHEVVEIGDIELELDIDARTVE